MNQLRDRAAIVGVGHTGCHKDAGVPPAVLWVRACKEAIADAGLQVQDVDGICSLHTSPVSNATAPTPFYLSEALGLPQLRWHSGALGGAYGAGLVGAAAIAVATGQCDVALAIHTMARPKGERTGPSNNLVAPTMAGNMAYLAPYGYAVFIQWLAAWYRRYQHETGVTREQVGRMVVDQRNAAIRNEKAVMRQPLTLEQYLSARWIAEPLCLFDADMPVDAAVAWVVTSADRARDSAQKPVYISNAATWLGPRPDFVFHHDYTEMFPTRLCEQFWRDADASPEDMDFAQLHDGFSIYTLYWLEALGFVKKGEAGAFVGSGEINPESGRLPTNTHGGNLSEGRLQSAGHVVEAVLQLRGQAGARQVEGAEIGVVSSGGAPTAGVVLLHV